MSINYDDIVNTLSEELKTLNPASAEYEAREVIHNIIINNIRFKILVDLGINDIIINTESYEKAMVEIFKHAMVFGMLLQERIDSVRELEKVLVE